MDGGAGEMLSAVCSFTGYRPEKLPFGGRRDSEGYRRLYSVLFGEIEALVQKGVRTFQCGMARGVDLMCGQIVVELKEKYNIGLISVLPCTDQCRLWAREDQEIYNRLLRSSDSVVEITSEPYSDGCMLKRNRFLVETAQYLLAVFDGKHGGTMYTVNYAKKLKRTVIIINPASYMRIELVHEKNKGVLYV